MEKIIKKLILSLTTTGSIELENEKTKSLKKLCKTCGESSLTVAFEIIMKQLSKPHSEIRFSAFQLLQMLFERSHKFRLLTIEQIHKIFELTLETDPSKPIPPPSNARLRLRTMALSTLEKWSESSFGDVYPLIRVAYNYLHRRMSRIQSNIANSSESVRSNVDSERNLRLQNIWKERVRRVVLEMDEMSGPSGEITDCVTEVENLLSLLVPDMTSVDDGGDFLSADDEARCHGILSSQISTPNIVASIDFKTIEHTGASLRNRSDFDDDILVENLKAQSLLLRNRLIPTALKWSTTLTKSKTGCESELIRAINLKQKLELLQKRVLLVLQTDSDVDDTDDFIEVPVIDLCSVDNIKSTVGKNEQQIEERDFLEASSSHGSDDIRCHIGGKLVHIPKILPPDYRLRSSLVSNKLRFVVDGDKNTVWGSANLRDDGEVLEVDDPATTSAIVAPEKTFDSAKLITHTCGAPLAKSGKFCPRQDRYKCPFHGPIIPRSSGTGQTSNTDSTGNENNSQTDWQDPSLLQDILVTTGRDLTIGGTRSKKKRKKSHGLTDISEGAFCNSRKRLEKKIFGCRKRRK